MVNYDVNIGLEIHAQLSTSSKVFNSDANQYGAEPNINVSPITLGHPGTLPVLNKKVVEYAIKMGLACESEITREIIFDRKNYFYPDLPKGYQITQDNAPICVGGSLTISTESNETQVALNRIHIEEDAGKSIHLEGEDDTLVDFNRAGVPLIEIVTEPVISNAKEARATLAEVRKVLRYLEICDGNMEEGSLRCDVNISIKPKGTAELGKKVEVKNLNSTRNVERAINSEVKRQTELADQNKVIISETRTFIDQTGETKALRTKENLNDYRYFPDPDLSPVHISEEWLDSIRKSMPRLPREMVKHLMSKYQLPKYDAEFLSESKHMASYFEELTVYVSNYKAVSNWLMGPIKSYLNEHHLDMQSMPITAQHLGELINLVNDNIVSFSVASNRLLPAMLESTFDSVERLAEEMNLVQDSNSEELEKLIEEVLNEFPEKVIAFKKGKKGLLGMFVGVVMKRSGGKANPKLLNELLINKLR